MTSISRWKQGSYFSEIQHVCPFHKGTNFHCYVHDIFGTFDLAWRRVILQLITDEDFAAMKNLRLVCKAFAAHRPLFAYVANKAAKQAIERTTTFNGNTFYVDIRKNYPAYEAHRVPYPIYYSVDGYPVVGDFWVFVNLLINAWDKQQNLQCNVVVCNYHNRNIFVVVPFEWKAYNKSYYQRKAVGFCIRLAQLFDAMGWTLPFAELMRKQYQTFFTWAIRKRGISAVERLVQFCQLFVNCKLTRTGLNVLTCEEYETTSSIDDAT